VVDHGQLAFDNAHQGDVERAASEVVDDPLAVPQVALLLVGKGQAGGDGLL